MADSISQILLQKEQTLLHPDNRADAGFLTRNLSPDFIEIGASGRQFTLADIIEHLAEVPGFDTTRTIENFTTTKLAESTWIAHYRIPESRTQRTSIWQQLDDHWVMRFHQGTVEKI